MDKLISKPKLGSTIEKLLAMRIMPSEKVQNLMNSCDEMHKLRLEEARLTRELKIAVICEKSVANYLSVFNDRTGKEYFVEHNEQLHMSIREYEMHSLQNLKTYTTKKKRDEEKNGIK